MAAFVIGLGASPALADPFYELDALIPVPATSANLAPGGAFTTYDISYFDANTQLYYLGDRSNAVVDVFSAATNSFVTQIGLGSFSGIQPPPPAPANNDISGPNGVLVVNQAGQHVLYAGNGDSTLKAFNLAVAGNPQIASVATGPASANRVDEMAFSPTLNRLAVANNAAPVPFVTLINTTNNTIAAQTFFNGTNGAPNATAGAEQSVWDPVSQKFYISIPQANGTGPGGIATIDPNSGLVLNYTDLSSFGISGCSPAGLAGNAAGQLMIGCGDAGQSILYDPKANGGKGAIVKVYPQVSGSDMVWYDPTSGRFFLAARNNPGGPVLGVIDGTTDEFLTNLPTTPGDHSVAVDPVSDEIFVPFGGVAGNTICPKGCIAVYGLVPEPGSLPMIAMSLLGFAALSRAWQRRNHRG
jgi:hypothetical protein